MASSSDLVLRFEFSSNPNADMRTVQVHQIIDESQTPVELYKLHHPNTGLTTGVTSIQRKNAETQLWENAGQIEWSSNTSGAVYFGVERVSIRELRKPKKPSSKSRRFKAGSSEYKWKLAENGSDMICVSDNLGNRGKMIAQWSQDTFTLRVTERAEGFLDRVVVTCFLHLWFRRFNIW
ncbi:hypothetical protein L226DRAFT_571316 [Lentinus tigrinus ALCF2SS1-7]|uniref:DUF6593 domain-containing protein n=1 Tax=Lentinus tigrinus ALCF2SS1-6 TaxID=1328759 RepID=A0A5C2SDP3_9APHY|nr:hypothetical protein L227DRAFT_44047 [Lentinus tigrinus ALCF2SS1-6]RPD74421.1 hypothetical protein L226DRAFT_571316 [Lentinus tigrinus ALCF2SS1-7]